MRRENCSECGASHGLSSLNWVNERLLCPSCTQKARAAFTGKPADFVAHSLIDPTVCFQCKRDNGNSELPVVGKLPFCPDCRQALYDRPFPRWLRLAMLGLLILLAAALAHSVPYWRAGKDLVIGERLVQGRDYRQAVVPLHNVLKIAPESEKAILLLAKADILSGNPGEVGRLVSGRQFKDTPLFHEIDRLMGRVGKAFSKAEEAQKLAKQNRWNDAARAMHEAASFYPELPDFDESAAGLEISSAWEEKDYDRFVAISERNWKNHPNSHNAAGSLASALACKYAVTNDPAFRTRAEELLARSRELAASSPEALADQQEYEERIRYRLTSREIIDREEYNRRFRQQQPSK
jgi:hypothetical protein